MQPNPVPNGDVDSDAMQGAGEEKGSPENSFSGAKERTESYQVYDGGAPEPATRQGAESDGSRANAVNSSLDEAILYAEKYLEDLLSFFGLNTEVHATSDDEVIQLNVPSTHLNGFLIGHNGENMRSLQYLVSTALKNNGYAHNRVNVDIADYKRQRADRLRERAEEWVKKVKDSGEAMDLQPMNAADRRVVHQLAAEHGLGSESAGEGRDRHIVLKPAAE